MVRTKLLTIYTTMKKLFLLLALVGMVATAYADDGVNEPTNTPTETPDDGNDEKPVDNTPEDKTQPIKFIDNRVKALCVDSWDTNGDAELSYEEAAASKSKVYRTAYGVFIAREYTSAGATIVLVSALFYAASLLIRSVRK